MYLPALRERKEDIPLLVADALRKLTPEGGEPRTLSPDTMDILLAHDWPGNVRELRNVLERAIYLGKSSPSGSFLSFRDIGAGSADGAPLGGEHELHFDSRLSYRDNKERWSDEFERRYLKWLLARSEGNISRAAREADMDRKYLHKLLKKHNIVV